MLVKLGSYCPTHLPCATGSELYHEPNGLLYCGAIKTRLQLLKTIFRAQTGPETFRVFVVCPYHRQLGA